MRYLITFLSVLFATAGISQLPSYRQTDWNNAGAKVSFSQDTVYFSSYLINGIEPDVAIVSALAETALKKGVLQFDTGTYFFKKPLKLPADIQIIGQGSANTHLVFDLQGTGHLIQILGYSTQQKQVLTENAYKGETAVNVALNHTFAAGDWLKIGEENDELITSDWAKGSVHQIVRIRKIQGNTLLLEDALRLNVSLNKQAFVTSFNPIENIELSNFHLLRKDKTTGQTANIYLSHAANVLIKNIQSDSCNFAHFQIEESSNISINGCYIKTAFDYGGGGKAYGIALQFGTGNCLIENNIFAKLRHSVLLQAGANGNVIGYNYSREPFWTETQFPSGLAGDLVLHGNAPFLNLFEGNICQNIVIDDSHGKNGEYNTFFRNRAEYYGLFMNAAPASDSQNFIGNELTGVGTIKAGIFTIPLGNYTLSGINHYEQFNLLPQSTVPANSESLTSASMYLNNKPNWWNAKLPFPFCGDRSTFNQNHNPAYLRYFYNSTKTADVITDTSELKLNINLEKDFLAVNWSTNASKPTRSFELKWKDDSQTEVILYSMHTNGNEKLSQLNYYFHDYRKHLTGQQFYNVIQHFTDGSSIQSNWVGITIQEALQTPSVLFYPNPANQKVTFNAKGNYKIYNMNGTLMHDFDIGLASELAVENWPRGIYTIIHNSGIGLFKERLIKN